jgi:Protein of unknown function, DUF481
MSTRRLLPVLLLCLAIGGSSMAAAQAPAAPAASPAAPASPDQVVVLRLANNSLLVGHIVREEGDSIVFDAGTLGQITIKRADIVAQLDPSAVAAAFQGAQAAAGGQPPTNGLAGFSNTGKVLWTRFITFGGAYTSAPFIQGVIDPTIPALTGELLRLPGRQYTVQGQATIVRATSLGIAFVDASLNYTAYDPFGKQTDVPKIAGGYNFRLKTGQKLYGVTRYTWYKDRVRQIDYSNQLLFGLGIHTVDTKKTKLDVVPGLAVIREKKGTPFDDEWQGGWGFLEQLTFAPYPFGQIEQREMYYQLFNDSSYRGLESYIGFKGMLSKQLGVQFGLSHIYDNAIAQRTTPIPANALFPGQPAFNLFANEKSQVFITAGMLVRF